MVEKGGHGTAKELAHALKIRNSGMSTGKKTTNFSILYERAEILGSWNRPNPPPGHWMGQHPAPRASHTAYVVRPRVLPRRVTVPPDTSIVSPRVRGLEWGRVAWGLLLIGDGGSGIVPPPPILTLCFDCHRSLASPSMAGVTAGRAAIRGCTKARRSLRRGLRCAPGVPQH